MAGRGAAPKDPDQVTPQQAAKAKNQMRVVIDETAPPPKLPRYMPDGDSWPKQTLVWWRSWTNNPLTEDYRESDWLDLLDCATIHGRLWRGEGSAAPELRLRMARHGATREDRARLRITFATAEQVEKRAGAVNTVGTSTPGSRARRNGLAAVPATETG